MKRIYVLYLLLILCNFSFAQNIVKDSYMSKTKKVVDFYDEYTELIHEGDTIVAKQSLNTLLKSFAVYPYKNVVSLLFRGIYNDELSRSDKAMDNYLQALINLRSYRKNNYSTRVLDFRISMLVALQYFDKLDYEHGMPYLLSSIENAEKINDNSGLANLYSLLAIVYSIEENISDKTISYLKKAYKQSQLINDTKTSLYSKTILLHILLNSGKYDEVNHLMSESPIHVEEIEDEEWLNMYMTLKLKLAVHDKDFISAQRYIDKIDNNNEDVEDKMYLGYYKGLLAFERNSFDEAIEYFRKLELDYKNKNNWTSLFNLYYRLSKEYIKHKKYSNAQLALDNMYVVNDSLMKRRVNKIISNAESQYKFNKIETKLDYAFKVSVLKTNFLYVLGIFLFLLLLILMRLIILNRRIKRKNIVLVRKTKENTKKEIGTIDVKVESDLIRVIIEVVEKQSFYLDSEAKLSKLVEMVDSNTSYVSEAINVHYKKNFSTLINELRIQDVLKKIEQEDLKKYTIESLAKSVGFKSRTPFYNAFKAYTGVTPSYYINKEI